nr:MAG: replicase polyprotein [Bee Macula-like virus]
MSAGTSSAGQALSASIHRDAYLNPVLQHAAPELTSALDRYPYQLESSLVDKLRAFGIGASHLATKAHPHPYHKTLELFYHHTVLPNLLTQPTTVLFMKPAKFHALARLYPELTELRCQVLTGRDLSRYTLTQAIRVNTPMAYLDYALMFYTPAQIASIFLSNPQLHTLYATLIVPAESSFTDYSFEPSIYHFIRSQDGKVLHYYLERSANGHYEQPATALDWLLINRITSDHGLELTVTLHSTHASHHLLIISRQAAKFADGERAFDTPDAVLLPQPDDVSLPDAHRLVPRAVYDSLFSYVRSVRTLRESDPSGLIRQHRNKPEFAWVSPAAWDALIQYAHSTYAYRPGLRFSLRETWFSQLRCTLARWLDPRWNLYSGVGYVVLAGGTFLYLKYCASRGSLMLPTLALFKFFPASCRRYCAPFADILPERPSGPALLPRLTWSIRNLHWLLLDRLHTSLHPAPIARLSPHLQLRFIPATFQWFSLRTHLLAVSLPPILHALFRRFGPAHSYKVYTQLAHPKPFQLLLPCHGVHVAPQPFDFLPGLPYHRALSPPLPEDQKPPPAPPFTQPVLKAEVNVPPLISSIMRDEPPATDDPAEPTPNQPSQSASPSSELSPAPVIQAKADSSTLPVESSAFQNQPPTPAPRLNVNPPASPAAPEPVVPSALSKQMHESLPLATGTETDPFLLPEFVAAAPTGVQAVSAAPFCTPVGPPTSSPPQDAPLSPLDADPSGAPGLSQPFHLIHNYPPSSDIMWPSKRRVLPASTLPIPANRCLLDAMADVIPRHSASSLWALLCGMLPDCQLDNREIRTIGLSTEHLSALAWRLQAHFTVVSDHTGTYGNPRAQADRHFTIYHGSNHFSSSPVKRGAGLPIPRSIRHSDYSPLHKFVTSSGHRLPFQRFHKYTTHRDRAKNLISNMKNLHDGVLLSTDSTNLHERILQIDRCIDVSRDRSVSLIHLSGAPGCGKTAPLAQAIRALGWKHRVRVAVPTTNLRPEWRRHLHLEESQGYRVSTWETALTKTAEILIIDEVYRLPNGYLDLAVLADPNVRLVILLGDPVQAHYHSTHPASTNCLIQPEYKHLAPFRDYYCAYSYRLPRQLSRLLGLGAFGEKESMLVTATNQPNTQHRILALSQHIARALSDMGYYAITWASSQGLDLDGPAVLHIDRNIRLTSENIILVALTRSKTGVIFTGDVSHLRQSSGLLHALLTNQPYSYVTAFADFIGSSTIIYEPLPARLVGSSPTPPPLLPPGTKMDHLSTFDVLFEHAPIRFEPGDNPDPLHLPLHFLPPSRAPLHRAIAPVLPTSTTPSSAELPPPPITAVIPGECFESLASSFMPAHDPLVRERLFKGEFTRQFPYLNREFTLGPQPLSLLAPIHSPSQDPTLLPSSIDKRLRFRRTHAPYDITANDEFLGQQLFQAWSHLQHIPSNVLFDEHLFAECINFNEYAQLTNKTKNVIANNEDRSDPDWRYTWVRIFAKAQHKVNAASIFTDYKACQTLALMHDYVILTLGPVKKYQRAIHARYRPDNIYVHAAHSPQGLSDYCQQHLKTQIALTNDYTAFDQSQHGEAVVFEREKMLQLGIPRQLVDLHIYLKTNVETQFGPLTCMRLTGEPGTYDDNTDYNLAVLALRYVLTSRHVIFVSGDDSAIFPPPADNPKWKTIDPLIALRFKIQVDRYPLFCGYYLGPAGACRDPLALFAKFAIAYDAGELELKMPSYIAEFSIGHLLGDSVFSLLPPSHVLFYSAVFDLICRKASVDQKTILNIHTAPEHRLLRFLQRARYFTYTAARILQAALGVTARVNAPGDLPLEPTAEGELLPSGHDGTLAGGTRTAAL